MKQLICFFIIIVVLISTIFVLYRQTKHLRIQLSDAQNNTKTLLLENDKLNSASRTLKLTIEQLESSSDSISKALMKSLSENKIKKKKISQLQYALTTNFKIDTVVFKDTLFVNNIKLDTCIRDH